MRKYSPFILIALFPYLIVFTLICIFTDSIVASVFNNNALLFLFILVVLYIIALICALATFILALTKKKKSTDLLRINMIIKLIHIPAYLIIFVFGLLSTLTIFTIGLSIVLMMLDGITITLSGLIGLGGVISSFKEKKISRKKAVIHSIFQFVFCVDIISSIIMYKTVKVKE